MLQKRSFREPKLPRYDDTIKRWYEVHEINCDVLALWETGYKWALGAFPYAHERPLMAQDMDFSKLPNVGHRDYDLLLLAASSGCPEFTAKKFADRIPVEVPERLPLLLATLQGVAASVYYESNFLLDVLDDMLTKGAKLDCVSCFLVPYEKGTIPVSEGILECSVWLLDHRAMKPSYESETWRQNHYRIWEVLERY